MGELLQKPELLTYLSYLALGGLSVWVVAHALEIFNSLWLDGPKEWKEQAGQLSRELESNGQEIQEKLHQLSRLHRKVAGRKALRTKAEHAQKIAAIIRREAQGVKEAEELLISSYPESKKDVGALVSKIRAAESDDFARDLILLNAAGCTAVQQDIAKALDRSITRSLNRREAELRRQISARVGLGPEDKLSGWLENHPAKLEPGILRLVRSAEACPPAGIQEDPLLANLVCQETSPWRLRFGVPAMAAPAAGAAPTMSGTMAFLGDYSVSIEEGSRIPSMVGLNDALVTTWIGCTLTVVSVVLLAVVVSRIQGRWRERKNSADTILLAYSLWSRAVRKARSLEGQNV